MYRYKNKVIGLCLITLASISNENMADGNVKTYRVNFDRPEIQLQTLKEIEQQVTDKSENNEDLKILFYSAGKALRLDADAIPGVNIKYQNTAPEIREKIEALKKKGVRFLLCDRVKQDKKPGIGANRVTITSSSSRDNNTDLEELESQGYNCIKP